MKVQNWKDLFDNDWKTLRKIGETKFVQSMYIWIFLVPILVKLFEAVPEQKTINLLIFEYTLTLNPSLPFSWKAFYVSALFLALSNLIIKFRCPKIIKDHLSYRSFKSDGKTKQQLYSYAEDIEFNLELFEESLQDKQYEIHDTNLRVDLSDPAHYFWPIFEKASIQHFNSRRTCTILLYIGFLLFTWVSIENIVTVTRFIF